MGADEKLEVRVRGISVGAGDVLLLCSDGLHGVASDEELGEILSRDDPLKARCQALIDAALANGAPDNATAVLIERNEGG